MTKVSARRRWMTPANAQNYIHERIKTKGVVTADVLAEEIGQGVRSVYRHIRVLKARGVPIEGAPGFGYGYVACKEKKEPVMADEPIGVQITKLIFEKYPDIAQCDPDVIATVTNDMATTWAGILAAVYARVSAEACLQVNDRFSETVLREMPAILGLSLQKSRAN